MKDMMNMCKCPKCGYEADETEFKNKPMAKGPSKGHSLEIYLIGSKDDEGGSSEEENS